MATRRTRIKGIANIPQRRKATNTSNNEETDIKPNLNLEDEIPLNGDVTEQLESQEPSPPNQDKTPIRRKFIKPTISVNSIIRKERNEDSTGVTLPVTGKIVILDRVITSPGQDKAIVINNANFQQPTDADFRRFPPASPQAELEYPIPPPSPNKINRARIKAIPRLGQRHHSFSASESEDESRKNSRQRNDSVCSSASGLPETTDCPSPQKPREFNSVIQRKCRRTEQSRKLAQARQDFLQKFGDKKPDRQKLTMIDLIFYNPVTNPMSSNGKTKRTVSESSTVEEDKEEVVEEQPGSDEENEVPAPQIKIGPGGELVVDEQSLVIENKSVKRTREEMEKSEVVNGDFDTGYGIYKRAKRSKDWNKAETLKFYKALNTIGTDFTLMCELFPRRSRRELKMKFKKEEKINKTLVDKAIMQPCGFDFNDFKHEVDMEEKELETLERMKARKKEQRLEAKRKKVEKQERPKAKKTNMDIFDALEDGSDADESDVDSVEELSTIQKPTRSGRVPKILNRYSGEEENKSLNAEPGSLIVAASTGPNGQPIYKVCMVTDDREKKQIGEDMTSLQKALEWKDKGLTNLFTLSAAEIPENNVTISHEDP